MKLFKKHSPFVIFSVYRHRDEAEDSADHAATLKHLDRMGIPALSVLGKYDGKAEQSILIDGYYEDVAQTVAHKYNQESILRVGGDLGTYIVLTGPVRSAQYIGQWTEIDNPTGHDYTTNPYSGKHYIAT